MSKTRRIPSSGEDPVHQTASLVDISFLLLVFFVVTSTILKKEQDLAMQLPRPGQVDPVPALPAWIAIREDGAVEFGRGGGAMVMAGGSGMRELAGHLATAREAAKPDLLPVTLDVADGAKQQRFIDVLDCLAGLGIGQVTMIDRGPGDWEE